MLIKESTCYFCCHDSWLYGILSLPEQSLSTRGVLIIVGGPQYRIGSHRQFTLLARYLAAKGIPVMRFDYRGMGDSEGEIRTFEAVHDDINSAIDYFTKEVPDLREIVIWGLCDAASAALFYAYQDNRVTGLVLLNPWIRTEQGIAKTYLKHYYFNRLTDRTLWKKILSGNFDYLSAIRSLFKTIASLVKRQKKNSEAENSSCQSITTDASLPDRIFKGFNNFNGNVLLIISENDLTAQEFVDLTKESEKWNTLLKSPNIQYLVLSNANHTFSKQEWREKVFSWTSDWIITYRNQ